MKSNLFLDQKKFIKLKDRCLIIYNDSGNLTSIIGLIFLNVYYNFTKSVEPRHLFVHTFLRKDKYHFPPYMKSFYNND
ncbi:hypothetical protein EB821_02180 [Candidatus Marinimicrobia bacterium PRS2]|nr:hypothetical protein EB821_02180 [Candidatus Marinimicrobia bacterium PRS2]